MMFVGIRSAEVIAIEVVRVVGADGLVLVFLFKGVYLYGDRYVDACEPVADVACVGVSTKSRSSLRILRVGVA